MNEPSATIFVSSAAISSADPSHTTMRSGVVTRAMDPIQSNKAWFACKVIVKGIDLALVRPQGSNEPAGPASGRVSSAEKPATAEHARRNQGAM